MRKGYYGAVYYTNERKVMFGGAEDKPNRNGRFSPNSGLPVIFASRPNGRIWEANGRGVVYRYALADAAVDK